MADEHQRFSDAEAQEETAVIADQAQPKEESKAEKKKLEGPKKRYIVFVGNLPYDVTKNDLEDLFKNLGDIFVLFILLADCFVVIEYSSIRLLTDKVTQKPRGIAFVELIDSVNLEVLKISCCPSQDTNKFSQIRRH